MPETVGLGVLCLPCKLTSPETRDIAIFLNTKIPHPSQVVVTEYGPGIWAFVALAHPGQSLFLCNLFHFWFKVKT